MLGETSAATGTGERSGTSSVELLVKRGSGFAADVTGGNVKQKPLFPNQHRRRSRRSRQLMRQKKEKRAYSAR